MIIDHLKNSSQYAPVHPNFQKAFDFIKKHYAVINVVSGIALVAVGILMMTGTLGRLLSLLS